MITCWNESFIIANYHFIAIYVYTILSCCMQFDIGYRDTNIYTQIDAS